MNQGIAEPEARKPFGGFDGLFEASVLEVAFGPLIGATSGNELHASLLRRLREEYERVRQLLDPDTQAHLDQAAQKVEEALKQFLEVLSVSLKPNEATR